MPRANVGITQRLPSVYLDEETFVTLFKSDEPRHACMPHHVGAFTLQSGTNSSITKLHARALPVGATKLIFLVIFPREFQSRRVGIETPQF